MLLALTLIALLSISLALSTIALLISLGNRKAMLDIIGPKVDLLDIQLREILRRK